MASQGKRPTRMFVRGAVFLLVGIGLSLMLAEALVVRRSLRGGPADVWGAFLWLWIACHIVISYILIVLTGLCRSAVRTLRAKARLPRAERILLWTAAAAAAGYAGGIVGMALTW